MAGNRTVDLNSNYLTFTNGTLNIAQGYLLVQAETNLGSTMVGFTKLNGDPTFTFLDNGNVIIGGNSTIDLDGNILTFDGDLILNSNVNTPNLPTASTGLSSGDLWNENGVVRVGTSGGAIGGNTIYTADDSLVDNRTINLNGKNLTFQKLSSTTEYTKIYRNGGLEVRGSGFDTGNDVFKVKYRASGNDLLAVGQNGGFTLDSIINMGQFNSTWNYGQRFSDGYISFLNGATWNDNEVIRFDLRNNSNPTLTFNRNGQGTTGNRFIVRSSLLAETNYGTSKEQISLQGNTLIKGDTGTERTSYNFKVANSSLEPSFMVFNNKDVIIGASTKVSSEKISLQGSTAIKGIGTSGSSALAIYDNDTTPNKLWDFLDNGNLNGSNNRITNTIVNPSVNEATTSGFLIINSDEETMSILTAMSTATSISSPTGTPVQGQKLTFRFKDDGTARALTWNAIFRAIGLTLPTTTTANKTIYIGCIYNSTETKWDVIAIKEEV